MSEVHIFINGKKSLFDRVVRSAFCEDNIFAFESLRSYGGTIFRLEKHLDRLFETANTVGLKLPKGRMELKKELISCLAQSSQLDAFLRLGVDNENSYVLILERKRPAWIYEKGVCLQTAVTRRNFTKAEPSEPKTSAFFNNILGVLGKRNSDVYDAIFLDASGYVT